MKKNISWEIWMLSHFSCASSDFACLVKKQLNQWKTFFPRVNAKLKNIFSLFISKTFTLCAIIAFFFCALKCCMIYVNLHTHTRITKCSPYLRNFVAQMKLSNRRRQILFPPQVKIFWVPPALWTKNSFYEGIIKNSVFVLH